MNSRLPSWFKQELPNPATSANINLLSDYGINTVCQEARCPNLTYCFKRKDLTFLILGDVCTRSCSFCGVSKLPQGKLSLDQEEPRRIQRIIQKLGLDYVVITSVTRDDLEDGGAAFFARTIRLVHELNKDIQVEVLIPDFQGKIKSLECVLAAKPQVLAHNLETVKRLYGTLRPEADYNLSLGLIAKTKELNIDLLTKSSLMLGLGETDAEVTEAMRDLRFHHCDILALGQYLPPSPAHYPVREFIAPRQFKRFEDIAKLLGFKAVLSGPLVRSSYQAKEVYRSCLCMT